MTFFSPNFIISSKYNYTVDYFELRAQTGRYGILTQGNSWQEDIDGVLVHPINLSNAIVIGGTSRRSDEMLRVLGVIDVGGIRIGDSYIKETLDGLVFFDPILNSEISLSSIIGQYWSRSNVDHWLFPKNTTDSLLLGQSLGSALKRLQITSEADDGSSHLIFGKNSSGVDIFSVSDQGSVFLKGNLLFSTTEYISRSPTYLDFKVETLSAVKIYKDHIDGLNFSIQSSNPFYSRVGHLTDGIGFPADNEVAVYTNNINALNVSATQLTFPKNNWIFSGKNLLRVRTDDVIELGGFAFDDVAKIFYMTPDLFISRDPAGNMIFDDEFVGPVSLTQLISTSSSYWDRSSGGILSPRITTDSVTLPVLAGTGTRIVFLTTDGTLIPGTYDPPVDLYSNATPMPQGLGGIPSSTFFVNRTMKQMFDDLLYIYQVPAFTAFSISGQATTLEVGDSIAANRTFTWTTSNSGNITGNLIIRDDTGGSDIATGALNSGLTTTYPAIQKITATSNQFSITGTSTKSVAFSRTYVVYWRWKIFYGESTSTPLAEADIEGLRVGVLSAGFAGTYSFQTLTNGYKYISYPLALGTATSFKDTATQLPVPMEPVYTISVTNTFGIVTLYNVHRSTYILNGAVNIIVA